MSGCGDLKRENPLDPGLNGGTLREQLVGSWSRSDEAAANEIFIFKVDGSVERRSYSSPAGGAVDRNQSFPTTRVRIFAGTYTLVGNLMTLFYTRAQSNDPADNLQLPSGDTVIAIAIQRSTLTMTLTDGKLFYARLN
jgi:hypothetical protein